MNRCQVVDCPRPVSKVGYAFCLDHWKADRAGGLKPCPNCRRPYDTVGPTCKACAAATPPVSPATPPGLAAAPAPADDEGEFLSATRLGQHFGLSNIKTNLILAELGWIERYVKGWVPTERGNLLGANVREMRNGTPFVTWPESILNNAALRSSVAEQAPQTAAAQTSPPPEPGPANAGLEIPRAARPRQTSRRQGAQRQVRRLSRQIPRHLPHPGRPHGPLPGRGPDR